MYHPGAFIGTTDMSLMLVRIRRRRRKFRRMCFHLVEYHVDRLIELLVRSGIFFCRVVIDNNVGVNAVPFHNPLFPFDIVAGEFRLVQKSAVKKSAGARGGKTVAKKKKATAKKSATKPNKRGKKLAVKKTAKKAVKKAVAKKAPAKKAAKKSVKKAAKKKTAAKKK